MEPFIRKYQPERIDAWVKKQDWDFHPEDPPHLKRAYEVSNSDLVLVVRTEQSHIGQLVTNLGKDRQKEMLLLQFFSYFVL